MACPQCEIGPLRCDDAMRAMYRELGTPDKNANSRKGRGLEWDQKFRIWERVRASNPEWVRFSIDTEARINRVWIQLAHGYRAASQGAHRESPHVRAWEIVKQAIARFNHNRD